MIPNDSSGKITGYQPGSVITLVRNPNWDKSTDYRPAYLDKIVVNEGNDITVANRQILQGQSMVGNRPTARRRRRSSRRRRPTTSRSTSRARSPGASATSR